MTESLRSGEGVSFQYRMSEGFGGKRGSIAPRQGKNAGQNRAYSRRRDYPRATAEAAAIRHQLQTADHTEIKMALLTPILGRTAKKKRPGLAGVTPQNIAKTQPRRITPPSQSLKIISQELPEVRIHRGGQKTQIIPTTQRPVTSLKPTYHHLQPGKNKPWRYRTVRVHRNRCTPKTLTTRMPATQSRKQRTHHSAHGVHYIRNQMDRQKGECPP